MSEFFNVTLDKDVVLDDNITSGFTGWSSEKILDEIVAYRVTKFEELSDVDVVNKEDKQVVVYSGDTGKFITIDFETMGDAVGISLKQLSKLGIVGTPTTPMIVDIPISTLDFKLPKVNILKFILGDQNVIKTANSFVNGESNTFVPDEMILFDGTVRLKTLFQYTMTDDEDIESTYDNYDVIVDKSKFKSISDFSVTASGLDELLNITAIPTDRLLIPTGDMNLSNVSNIDYFSLVATGVNPRVICSVDGGITWKTFVTDHWETINLTAADVKINGITPDVFNAINSTYWNLLITTNKIRFAYLMQDNNSYDGLTLQYDGIGHWEEAKNTEYDVIYASNSLLQVKVYFSGDVKINY